MPCHSSPYLQRKRNRLGGPTALSHGPRYILVALRLPQGVAASAGEWSGRAVGFLPLLVAWQLGLFTLIPPIGPVRIRLGAYILSTQKSVSRPRWAVGRALVPWAVFGGSVSLRPFPRSIRRGFAWAGLHLKCDGTPARRPRWAVGRASGISYCHGESPRGPAFLCVYFPYLAGRIRLEGL